MIQSIIWIYFCGLIFFLFGGAMNVGERFGNSDDYAEMVFMAFIWPIVILLYLWRGAEIFINRRL